MIDQAKEHLRYYYLDPGGYIFVPDCWVAALSAEITTKLFLYCVEWDVKPYSTQPIH